MRNDGKNGNSIVVVGVFLIVGVVASPCVGIVPFVPKGHARILILDVHAGEGEHCGRDGGVLRGVHADAVDVVSPEQSVGFVLAVREVAEVGGKVDDSRRTGFARGRGRGPAGEVDCQAWRKRQREDEGDRRLVQASRLRDVEELRAARAPGDEEVVILSRGDECVGASAVHIRRLRTEAEETCELSQSAMCQDHADVSLM